MDIFFRFVFGLSVIIAVLAVLISILKPNSSESWFMRMRSRDRQAYQRLLMACGNNKALADKMIAHEMLLDEKQTRYHATMHALGRIQNYRRANPRHTG